MNPQKTITDYEHFDDTEANLPQYRLMTQRQAYLEGKKHFDRIFPTGYRNLEPREARMQDIDIYQLGNLEC